MENSLTRKEAIEKITMLFHRKGYRRDFMLDEDRIQQGGSIRQCLEVFLKQYEAGEYADGSFHLITYAPYNDRITCDFKMKFDEQKSFLITEFLVTNLKTDDYRQYHLRHNNELPGSMTLESLFPKPKPWDWIKKGKFRP